MEITIKYFGQIAEATGRNEEVFEAKNADIESVKSFFIYKYNLTYNESTRIAVNQEFDSNIALKDGDEVAFIPPFAGG
jgi:molybdopterin converting factor small subunit